LAQDCVCVTVRPFCFALTHDMVAQLAITSNQGTAAIR
jgi:hypothetical protein